jgi:hypothetical protein
MLEDLILNGMLLFGAFFAVLWIGRVILFRFAPPWAVGPGGFLIDTTGRLGAFQMHDAETFNRMNAETPPSVDHGRCD